MKFTNKVVLNRAPVASEPTSEEVLQEVYILLEQAEANLEKAAELAKEEEEAANLSEQWYANLSSDAAERRNVALDLLKKLQ